MRLLSSYLAVLQGQGSGSGWDIGSEIRAAMTTIRRPNPVLFDVGANTGEWTRMVRGILGPDCRVFQFEPAEESWKLLCRQSDAHTTVVRAAVGDNPRVRIIRPGRQSGMGGVVYFEGNTVELPERTNGNSRSSPR